MARRQRISCLFDFGEILRGVCHFERLRAGSERLDLSSSRGLAQGLGMTLIISQSSIG